MKVISKIQRNLGSRAKVFRVEKFDGKHKDICICYQNCKHFKPRNEEENCAIAQIAFGASKVVGIVLVHSCNSYESNDK